MEYLNMPFTFILIFCLLFNSEVAKKNEIETDELSKWLALLLIETDDPSFFGRCGAALISDQWLLTAAHCVNLQNISTISITMTHFETSRGQKIPKYKIMPENIFVKVNYYYTSEKDQDIALLKLDTKIDLDKSANIKAIALRDSSEQFGKEKYFSFNVDLENDRALKVELSLESLVNCEYLYYQHILRQKYNLDDIKERENLIESMAKSIYSLKRFIGNTKLKEAFLGLLETYKTLNSNLFGALFVEVIIRLQNPITRVRIFNKNQREMFLCGRAENEVMHQSGDSGSPLIRIDDNGHYFIKGVFTFAVNNEIFFYTHVASHLDWIQKAMNGELKNLAQLDKESNKRRKKALYSVLDAFNDLTLIIGLTAIIQFIAYLFKAN